jgi:murein DD-endopeptidase MepM/ murein hydrolase activator NlpD
LILRGWVVMTKPQGNGPLFKDSILKLGLGQRFDRFCGKFLPERRVFLKSDTDTRFVRLSPSTQVLGLGVAVTVVAWTCVATALLVIDSIGAGNFREQAKRDQESYQLRLNTMAQAREQSISHATMAQDRYDIALKQVAVMQQELLQSELRRKELAAGLDVLQNRLRETLISKRKLDQDIEKLRLALADGGQTVTSMGSADHDMVAFLTTALNDTAAERDQLIKDTQTAQTYSQELELELRLTQERNEQIFRQIEEAMVVSIEPLNKLFKAAGMNPDRILDAVRSGYSGYGGPLAALSSRDTPPTPEELRAINIMQSLDEMNLYRLAVDKIPFYHPVQSSHRFTSGFGKRWGRLHAGADFAAAHGTPIYATADGTIVHAGWSSGYGRLIKIKHAFGIETRYGHLSKIRVKVGQKVSRGDRIGDMGNTGRSTGTHLHYEIRNNGKAVNPMNYLKAANDVF